VSWLQTNFLKTELELGHCLRTPAEGPCECDLVLSCSKFLTTSDYAPRLRARLAVEQQLIDDATARGWDREVERHQRVVDQIRCLLMNSDKYRGSAAGRKDDPYRRLRSARHREDLLCVALTEPLHDRPLPRAGDDGVSQSPCRARFGPNLRGKLERPR
jgi:hypothetical protein